VNRLELADLVVIAGRTLGLDIGTDGAAATHVAPGTQDRLTKVPSSTL
jgi:hypothetical protein